VVEDSSTRIFQLKFDFLFHFLALPLTTEAMGIGGLRELSLSPKRQSECGRKDR